MVLYLDMQGAAHTSPVYRLHRPIVFHEIMPVANHLRLAPLSDKSVAAEVKQPLLISLPVAGTGVF
jgi:hypothetical protein